VWHKKKLEKEAPAPVPEKSAVSPIRRRVRLVEAPKQPLATFGDVPALQEAALQLAQKVDEQPAAPETDPLEDAKQMNAIYEEENTRLVEENKRAKEVIEALTTERTKLEREFKDLSDAFTKRTSACDELISVNEKLRENNSNLEKLLVTAENERRALKAANTRAENKSEATKTLAAMQAIDTLVSQGLMSKEEGYDKLVSLARRK
jgi:chromosome segregation ATPase